MDNKRRFYDSYVSEHTTFLYGPESLDSIRAHFPIWKAYFKNLLPQDSAAKILDIGCGEGGFVEWLHESGFKNAEGIDISKEQIELGSKLGIENIREGDLFQFLKNNEGIYDGIVARDVFEHLTKNQVTETLELAHKSLKDSGAIIIQTANALNPLWGRLRHGDFTHEMAFTEGSIKQVLRSVGFKNIIIYPQRPISHGLISFVRRGLWLVVESIIRVYLLIETGTGKGIFTQNLIVVARKD